MSDLVFLTPTHSVQVTAEQRARLDAEVGGMSRENLENYYKVYKVLLLRTDAELEEKCAEALGYENDPEYGWVIGDHTGMSLFNELVSAYTELKTKHSELEADLRDARDRALYDGRRW